MIFRLLTTVFIIILSTNIYGQFDRYMIDNKKLSKSGSVGVKFRIEKWKEKRAENKEGREFYKLERKTKREKKKYRKRVQTRKVTRRMKKSERIAKRNTKNKPVDPFYKRWLNKIKKFYGR